MLSPVRVLVSGLRPWSRCSSYVSRMRFLNSLKEDDEACGKALSDSDLMLFHGLRPLLKTASDGSLSSVSLPATDVSSLLQRLGADSTLLQESVLIGCSEQGHAHFCLDLAPVDPASVEEDSGGRFVDLRKAFFLLPDSQAPLVAKSQALLRWHHTHRFCSVSGRPNERNRAGSHRTGPGNHFIYPQMSPVVIALVHDGSRCLLGRQASFPPGLYSALAGFCDMGECVEEAVRREVAEEAGLEVQTVTYHSSQHWPFPNSSFMIGCFAAVDLAHSELSVDHSELEDARWFSVEEIEAGLKVKTPPRRGQPVVTWFPPSHAIGHRLISEWAGLQRRTM